MSSAATSAHASGLFPLGDRSVHRLGFGTMRLTGPGVWGFPADRDEAIRVLRRAVDLGVTLFDTADAYGPIVAESLLQAALHPYPSDLTIATKAGFTRQGPNQWAPLGRPAYLRQQVELSLRHLRLDTIDVLQLHRVDPEVPLVESVGELRVLRDEGKIRHIGLSEVTVDQLTEAETVTPIVSVQNRYSVAERSAYEDVVDVATARGIAFLPWFPLHNGALARPGSPLQTLAERWGAKPSQLALAWLLHRSPVILPIPGTSSQDHLIENVAAAGLTLTAAEQDEIAAAAQAGS